MRRLLLTSLGMGALSDFVGRSPNNVTVAFIPTAGDPYNPPTFVDNDREKLQSMGFQLRELDIKNKNTQELKLDFVDTDLLYVAGGNSFYLLEKMRACGLDALLPQLLDKGLLYVGASAGAVVVCPNLEPISSLDDQSKAPGLKSTEGLSIVPFVVLPHSGKEKYAAKYNKILADYKDQYELIPLTDQQAIIVENGNHKIVTSL